MLNKLTVGFVGVSRFKFVPVKTIENELLELVVVGVNEVTVGVVKL